MSIADKLTTIAENEQKVYDVGKQAGIKAEYDRFWDGFQSDEIATGYSRVFASFRWNDDLYNPKYDLVLPSGETGTFMYNTRITDTKVNITVKGTTQQIFYYCNKLKTIRKLIVQEETTYNNMFYKCDSLENLTMEGTIAKAFNISGASKLSKTSIENVFSCLSDATTGLTATFSTTAKNNAFTTEEWDALVASKPNWTIALA